MVILTNFVSIYMIWIIITLFFGLLIGVDRHTETSYQRTQRDFGWNKCRVWWFNMPKMFMFGLISFGIYIGHNYIKSGIEWLSKKSYKNKKDC